MEEKIEQNNGLIGKASLLWAEIVVIHFKGADSQGPPPAVTHLPILTNWSLLNSKRYPGSHLGSCFYSRDNGDLRLESPKESPLMSALWCNYFPFDYPVHVHFCWLETTVPFNYRPRLYPYFLGMLVTGWLKVAGFTSWHQKYLLVK